MDFFLWITIVVSSTATLCGAVGDHHQWTYRIEGGVYEWCKEYHSCCGNQQSPINFDTNSVRTEEYAPISLHGYETKPNWINMKNNGHAIYIDVGYPGKVPEMSDGGLGDSYKLASFHFHWGSEEEQGSEHTVNGVYYPLELHIVHINSKYSELDTAFAKSDGLAVIGVFYEVTAEDNPALNDIINGLKSVKFNGDSKNISHPNFNLLDLFPASTDYFYRYFGSLTTPPCDEVVTWTVFEVPQTMSLKQLDAFRALMSSKEADKPNNMTLSDNYRPPQKLKGRKIFRRHVSGGNSVSAQFPMLLTAAASVLSSRLI